MRLSIKLVENGYVITEILPEWEDKTWVAETLHKLLDIVKDLADPTNEK